MRTLLIGILSATLIGCSCLATRQSMVESSCNTQDCFDLAAGAPVELKPAPFAPNVAAKKVAPTSKAKKTKTPPDHADNRTALVEEEHAPMIMRPEASASGQISEAKKPTSSMAAKTETSATGQSAETSDSVPKNDSVLKKAKSTIAAKMEDPASVEFGDMKRAVRKNTFGQRVDTICGHVKGKKASGEDTGDRPFLYLVKEDEAYVVNGNTESAAAIAYRNICISMDLGGKDLRQTQP